MFRPSVYGMNDVLKYLTGSRKIESVYIKRKV